MILKKQNGLKGELHIPGDKSISHRAIMIGAIAEGTTLVGNFLNGADCLSTIACFRRLGVSIEHNAASVTICGKGLYGLSAPASVLDVGNSGTTMRLLSGMLSAQPFTSKLTGDTSIQKRPMKRIIEPLSLMGASIKSLQKNDCAPLHITGQDLHGISYSSPVASAQVKSAILLAGLYADGQTSVTEPAVSRNHTELMLRCFGANVVTNGTTVLLPPGQSLKGQSLQVPGDISSAAYFIAAGLLIPGSDLLIRNVGINKTRDGILRVAKAMGGHLTLLNEQKNGEPTADIHVTASSLTGTVIEGDMIPTLIDELPIIAVMAAAAKGTTIIRDAAELKVKESNRIDVVAGYLSDMGCLVTKTDDGMIIEGGAPLTGTTIDPHHDHRIAMSFSIAGLLADGETNILDSDVVSVSYPGFYESLHNLSK